MKQSIHILGLVHLASQWIGLTQAAETTLPFSYYYSPYHEKCNDDTKLCAASEIVPRDPNDECKFYPCRNRCRNNNDALDGTCGGTDAIACPTGSVCEVGYQKDINSPEGWCCPEKCTNEKMKCPNGGKVRRNPDDDCNFFRCQGQCRTGTALVDTTCDANESNQKCPQGYTCEFGEQEGEGWCCPEITCPEDTRSCNGRTQTRNPNSNPPCEFYPCNECPGSKSKPFGECSSQYDCSIGTADDYICVYDGPQSKRDRTGWCCPSTLKECIKRKFDFKSNSYFSFTINGNSSEEAYKALKGSGAYCMENRKLTGIRLKYHYTLIDGSDYRGFSGRICLSVKNAKYYQVYYKGIGELKCYRLHCVREGASLYQSEKISFERPEKWNNICVDAKFNSAVTVYLTAKKKKVAVKNYIFEGCKERT